MEAHVQSFSTSVLDGEKLSASFLIVFTPENWAPLSVDRRFLDLRNGMDAKVLYPWGEGGGWEEATSYVQAVALSR